MKKRTKKLLKIGVRVVAACTLYFLAAATPALADGDVIAGKALFHRCSACHSTFKNQNGLGPSLFGVVGRKAGTVVDYDYSDAMKDSGTVWDTTALDIFLERPRDLIPGTKMQFTGIAEEPDRADLIAYLATLKPASDDGGLP